MQISSRVVVNGSKTVQQTHGVPSSQPPLETRGCPVVNYAGSAISDRLLIPAQESSVGAAPAQCEHGAAVTDKPGDGLSHLVRTLPACQLFCPSGK
jgi:hypothetical protein